MFSVLNRPEEFENATITGHLGFVFKENSVREVTWLSWHHRFRNASFSKRFSSTLKRKAGVFKFLLFEERFRKALLSWRISVDVRPKRVNKPPFSNSSFIVWTAGPIKCVNRYGRSPIKSLWVWAGRVSCITLSASAAFYWRMKLQKNMSLPSAATQTINCHKLRCFRSLAWQQLTWRQTCVLLVRVILLTS